MGACNFSLSIAHAHSQTVLCIVGGGGIRSIRHAGIKSDAKPPIRFHCNFHKSHEKFIMSRATYCGIECNIYYLSVAIDVRGMRAFYSVRVLRNVHSSRLRFPMPSLILRRCIAQFTVRFDWGQCQRCCEWPLSLGCSILFHLSRFVIMTIQFVKW